MSSSWLTLTNRVLEDLNETPVAGVTSSRGVQTVAKRGVQKAINWILTRERRWPFLMTTQNHDLTQGVSAYDLPTGYIDVMWTTFVLVPKNFVANGTFASNLASWTDISSGTGSVSQTGGLARFNGGASGVAALTQALSTVAGKSVRISGRVASGTLTAYVGTTSGGTEISSTDVAVQYAGDGEYFDITFTPTSSTTYLTFRTATNGNVDLDYVEVRENITPITLLWKEWDELVSMVPHGLTWLSENSLGTPRWVSKNNEDQFVLYPAPDRAVYQVQYDAYIMETALSVDASTSSIPTRYDEAIITMAKIPVAQLRSDPQLVADLKKEQKAWLGTMRMELINKERKAWAR